MNEDENINGEENLNFTDTAEAEQNAEAEDTKPAEKPSEGSASVSEKHSATEVIIDTIDADYEAIIKYVGENPYTGEKITDAEDAKEYLIMKKLSEAGKNPVTDYNKYLKELNRETQAKKSENDWFINDRKDFESKYPKVDLNTLINDKRFEKFAEGRVGKKPLAEIYSDYIFVTGEDKANKAAAQAVANMKATPGSLTNSNGTGATDFFTPDQVDNMTSEEVMKNYDKIRESMKKW